MEFKHKVNSDEWNTLLYSVMWVFHAVAGADGIIDKKEQMAIKTVCSKAGALNSELAEEILKETDNNIGNLFRQSMNDSRDYKVGLIETIKVLNQHLTPETNTNFRKVLLAIGFYIGNVSSDSGGNRLSKEELKVIGTLAGLLQISKEDMNTSPTVSEIMAIFAS